MTKMLGESEAERLFRALEGEPVRAFRVNEKKITVENFLSRERFDAQPILYTRDGFYTKEEHPGRTAEHHAGMIYMQDPSAMATLHTLRVQKGWRVLDACASPGGKSTQISAGIGRDGILVSNEYVTKRCRILRGNIERLGCDNAILLNVDTRNLSEQYPAFFDLAVCDAPCSGEGMFRKNDEAVTEWSPENVRMCAVRQIEILENVAKCVAPGGYLLYSTCTFSLEENEMNVDKFLSLHPEFSLCETEDDLKKHTADGINFEGCRNDMAKTRRFYPHLSPGEGQFIALMRREDNGEHVVQKYRASDDDVYRQNRTNIKVAEDFLRENLRQIPNNLTLIEYNGSLFLKPFAPLPRFGVFCPGVCVGEVKGQRLVPHHHLFSALGGLFENQLMLATGDPRVSAYLSGAEIPMRDGERFDGYGVLCVDGAPLGGVKASGGVCKNHYPKGLRRI